MKCEFEIESQDDLDDALERVAELKAFKPGTPQYEEADWLRAAIDIYRRNGRKALRLQLTRRLN